MPAEYVALAQELPAVYQDDEEAFAQLDGYLALVDEVFRTYAEDVAQVPSWLSPASSVWPPGVPIDAGADEVHAAILELYDTLAGWFAFRFPGSWRTDGIARRREFVGRAARIWRRRGTPRGFLDWFCLYFGIDAVADRPLLLEHFKYGAPAPGEAGLAAGLRATLLVPSPGFREYGRRVEAASFVQRYAPSHVVMRLCWVPDGYTLREPGVDADVEAYRALMRGDLCGLRDDVPHSSAVHLGTCVDEGTPRDRLDVGRLPGDGN